MARITQVLLEKGTGKTEEAQNIEIPDLWHVATLFADASMVYEEQQKLKASFAYPNEHDELDEVTITLKGPTLNKYKEAILDTWYTAHALKSHILKH